MTYDKFEAESEDLLYSLREGEISKAEYHMCIENLEEQWEDEGEE